MHDFIGARVRALADRLDRFFTDQRSLAEEQKSQLRITPTVESVEDRANDASVPIDGRLVMPRLEDKLRFQIRTVEDTEDDLVGDGETPVAARGDDETKPSTLLGLVYTTVAEQARNVSVRGGLRFSDGNVKPAVSARGRVTAPAGIWITRVTLSLFYDDDEFGASTLLDFDRLLGDATLFRSASRITVTETSEGAELLQSFLLRHLPTEHTGVELFFTTEAHTAPTTVADQYIVGVTYRTRVWKDWLTLSLRPELRYPRDIGFEREAALIIKFEAVF
ncbi:MAG: hypothetical protein OET44_03115 [Gammaproteobacteria bacterium]|nr:hypothetical protein [Gammaproteobacteria bacterium]